jgi:hypothetical protein
VPPVAGAQAQVQAPALEPVAAVQEQATERVPTVRQPARLSSPHTYRRNDYPPLTRPRTQGRPTERVVQGLPQAQEPPQAQLPLGPTLRHSYHRTTLQRPPTPHKQSKW